MHILILTRYGQLGSSSRVRFYQYIPYLQNRGCKVTISSLLDDEYIRQLYAGARRSKTRLVKAYLERLKQLPCAKQYDLIWLEKELFPMLPALAEHLLRNRIPYVVDYDDAVFHNYDQNPLILIRRLLSGKIDSVMRSAAAVVAGNKYIASRARRAGAKKICLLPSVVDADLYSMGKKNNEGPFVIGWIGSPVTACFLEPLKGVFQQLSDTISCRFVAVGAGKLPEFGLDQQVKKWRQEDEVLNIQGFDVGIMPLPDEPFARGKCGYKLIQYMACGVPVIASPVGVNSEIVDHGTNGFLAAGPEEWLEAFVKLQKSPDLRGQMGLEGRRKIEKEYSLQVTAPRLYHCLTEAIS